MCFIQSEAVFTGNEPSSSAVQDTTPIFQQVTSEVVPSDPLQPEAERPNRVTDADRLTLAEVLQVGSSGTENPATNVAR